VASTTISPLCSGLARGLSVIDAKKELDDQIFGQYARKTLESEIQAM
jgi:hypothetical protein